MESLRAGPMQSWKTFESGLHTAHPRSGSLAGRVGVCLRTAVRNLFGTWDQFCGNSFKILMLRKIEGRRRGQQRMRWMASPTQWTWVWASSWRWWWAGKPGMLQSMGSQSRTRLSDWTELIHFWCEWNLVQSLWKTVWKFLKQLKNRTTSNSTSGYIYKENENRISRDIHISVFEVK